MTVRVDFHPQISFVFFPSLASSQGPKIRHKSRLFLKKMQDKKSATKSVTKSVPLGRKSIAKSVSLGSGQTCTFSPFRLHI